jgi:hypothetical protein
MHERDFSYIIKVFEAQWDDQHDESVKPFFQQLRRDTAAIDERRRGRRRKRPGHDALFSYTVFQNVDGLRGDLNHQDRGALNRKKIAYFACHGRPNMICAVQDISRTQLKNILAERSDYDGFFFGACDFVNRDTATQLLTAATYCRWVAGYEKWTPWLEGTLCDLMFFRLLLTGRFNRPEVNARWIPVRKPEEAAMELYRSFPPSVDLHFSLFYRTSGGIRSSLDQYWDEFEKSD